MPNYAELCRTMPNDACAACIGAASPGWISITPLARSPVALPSPGTSRLARRAADPRLSVHHEGLQRSRVQEEAGRRVPAWYHPSSPVAAADEAGRDAVPVLGLGHVDGDFSDSEGILPDEEPNHATRAATCAPHFGVQAAKLNRSVQAPHRVNGKPKGCSADWNGRFRQTDPSNIRTLTRATDGCSFPMRPGKSLAGQRGGTGKRPHQAGERSGERGLHGGG